MITFIRRHAATLAVILTVAGFAAPAVVVAQDAPKAAPAAEAPAAPAAAPAAPAAKAMAPAPTITKETIENPYGLERSGRRATSSPAAR